MASTSDTVPVDAVRREDDDNNIGFKWAVEKLALPIALCVAPIIFQTCSSQLAAEERAAKEAEDLRRQSLQLYTSFLTSREQAETTLQQALFKEMVGTFFDSRVTQDPARRLVQLELLAVNFTDALNLNPLFWELHRQIQQLPRGPKRGELGAQLLRVAGEVKRRQSAVLQISGSFKDYDVDLACPASARSGFSCDYVWNEIGGEDKKAKTKRVEVKVWEKDDANRSLKVSLIATGGPNWEGWVSPAFWVDIFDFPLANFGRPTTEERLAVVLDEYGEAPGQAKLKVLFYPSSRSAVKDKPYIEDLAQRLHLLQEKAEKPEEKSTSFEWLWRQFGRNP